MPVRILDLRYTRAERRREARAHAQPHRRCAKPVPREKPVRYEDVHVPTTTYDLHCYWSGHREIGLYMPAGMKPQPHDLEALERKLAESAHR